MKEKHCNQLVYWKRFMLRNSFNFQELLQVRKTSGMGMDHYDANSWMVYISLLDLCPRFWGSQSTCIPNCQATWSSNPPSTDRNSACLVESGEVSARFRVLWYKPSNKWVILYMIKQLEVLRLIILIGTDMMLQFMTNRFSAESVNSKSFPDLQDLNHQLGDFRHLDAHLGHRSKCDAAGQRRKSPWSRPSSTSAGWFSCSRRSPTCPR